MAPLPDHLTLAVAEEKDLPSLSTIHHRAFHAGNEFHRRTWPNTPKIRQWWYDMFKVSMEDPAGKFLIVRDANDNNKTVGVLKYLRFEAGERGCGIWLNDVQLTEDHDVEAFRAALDPLAEHRERYLIDQPHYVVEFFGTDSNYQGTGVGTALLGRCCEIADSDGIAMFVEANGNAEPFYQRHGFETKESVILPGDLKYRECMMVRPKKA